MIRSSNSPAIPSWLFHVVTLGLTYYGLYVMCANSLADKPTAAIYAGGLMMFAGPVVFFVVMALLWIVRR